MQRGKDKGGADVSVERVAHKRKRRCQKHGRVAIDILKVVVWCPPRLLLAGNNDVVQSSRGDYLHFADDNVARSK